MLYSKNSPAIMSQLLSMVFVNFLAWQEEGMKGVKPGLASAGEG